MSLGNHRHRLCRRALSVKTYDVDYYGIIRCGYYVVYVIFCYLKISLKLEQREAEQSVYDTLSTEYLFYRQ